MQKRYLFFLRHYNDIDNIVPAIFFLLQRRPDALADVVIYSEDYAYQKDENLRFLAQQFPNRLRLKWLGDLLGLDYGNWFAFYQTTGGKLIRLMQRIINQALGNIVVDTSLVHYHPQLIMKKTKIVTDGYRDEIMQQILDDGLWPSLVVFDQNSTSSLTGGIGALRRLGVKTVVALPVSPRSNVNVLRHSGYTSPDINWLAAKQDHSLFDRVGHTDRFYAENLASIFTLHGRPSPLKGKVEVLGSARYCPEWLDVRQQFVSPYQRKTAKIRVVLFLSQPRVNCFWDEVLRTVHFLTHYSEFDVVVKPHTRGMSFGTGLEKSNITVDDDADSSALIDWADIVMLWGTSIGFEAYMKDKTVIVLDHVNANRNVYAMFNAGWVLACRDDLHEALSILAHDPTIRKFDQKNIQTMLAETVLGGSGESVPDNYLRFFDESEALTNKG